MNDDNRVLGVAQPVGIREANGFGNEWKPGGLPEPNPTEPAGETGFAAHPKRLFPKLPCRAGETPDVAGALHPHIEAAGITRPLQNEN